MLRRRTRTRLAICAFCLVLSLAVGACARMDPEREFELAVASLASGNYAETSIRLNNVIQTEPSNGDARKLRGELGLLTGNYALAADDFERALELGTPLESVALGLAEALTATGRVQRALEVLDAAEAVVGDDAAYLTARAEVLLGLGRLAETEAALAGLVGNDDPRVQIVRARVAFTRDDVVEAERLLGQALAVRPEDPRLLTARADLYARTDRFPEAAADLLRAADAYRTSGLTTREAATLLALAEIDVARNDLEALDRTVARLTESAPQATATAYLQALLAYRRGNFDEAASLIQPLVGSGPDTVQLRVLLGAINLARGNLGQAEQQFLAVLAVSPRNPVAVKLLAETRLRQQRPDAALAALRDVEGIAADDPQIWLLSGLASILTGNTEQGLLYLEQAASLDPTNELLRLQLARAYLAAGRDADAATLLGDAFDGGPEALEGRLLQLFADIRRGEHEQGTAVAEQILAEFPAEPRALVAAAIAFQIRGETARARELFERAAELDPDNATVRLFIAAGLAQEGRAQDAERVLTDFVRDQPTNAQALTALAELLAARGAVREAADLLRRAAEHSPSPAPRLALAQLYIAQGELAEAKQEVDAAAAAAPDQPEVGALMGILALAEGRPAEAAALLARVEPMLPNRIGVTLALARAELGSGQAEAARTRLRRVVTAAPRSLPLRFALGEAELAAGNAAEALSIANALKVDFPANSAGYQLEALVQIAERRYDAAVASLTAAFDREPAWPVLTRLLSALQLAGRHKEALEAVARWTASNPRHLTGVLTHAGMLQDAGRLDAALDAYLQALSIDDSNLIALNNAAWLSRTLDRPGALALAERAVQLAPDNPAVLDTLGWVLLAENREQDAIAHLSRAAELAPEAPEIRYHLAEGLAALGRSAEARAVLVELLREPEFGQRADAQRLLESL